MGMESDSDSSELEGDEAEGAAVAEIDVPEDPVASPAPPGEAAEGEPSGKHEALINVCCWPRATHGSRAAGTVAAD